MQEVSEPFSRFLKSNNESGVVKVFISEVKEGDNAERQHG